MDQLSRISHRMMVLGNWKMHGNLKDNTQLLEAISKQLSSAYSQQVDCAVLVPFPYLSMTQALLQSSGLAWGAQDVSHQTKGAFTGEVAAQMLQDFGCRYVIVGHSERRQYHQERSEIVAEKALRALEAGITPVVCFGETLAERQSNAYAEAIRRQLEPVWALGAEKVQSIVLAYEPVWAIGTGLSAEPEQAQEIHALVRAQLQTLGCSEVSILYGGSVKPENAAALFAMPDIDGGLIGGAALDATAFSAIIAAAFNARSE